jgi:hypothetical protein
MMNDQFTFASDPGHGWLLVTENQLIKAGLAPGHFTPYSFKHVWDDVQVYALEEDKDAGVFIRAWESKYGELIAWREWQTTGDHEVRGWSRIK